MNLKSDLVIQDTFHMIIGLKSFIYKLYKLITNTKKRLFLMPSACKVHANNIHYSKSSLFPLFLMHLSLNWKPKIETEATTPPLPDFCLLLTASLPLCCIATSLFTLTSPLLVSLALEKTTRKTYLIFCHFHTRCIISE